MKKITGTCPECKCEITPAFNQGQFNRNLGFHLRSAHGILGATTDMEKKRLMSRHSYWRKQGHSEAEMKKMEVEYLEKKKRLAAAEAAGLIPVKKKKSGQVEPLELNQCPRCRSEFYQRLEGNESLLSLSYCPNCKIRFYYAE